MTEPVKEIVKKSRKRARKQAEEIVTPEYVQANGDYNIWYHKRLGDRPAKRTDPSEHRCDPERDSGETKADSMPGKHFLCLYFARGKCVHGHRCQYYHRIPTEDDLKSIPVTHDIFGTGNFNRDNRTLYVGGLKNSRTNLEDTIRKEFGKYGEVEYVRVIPSRLIAFVRFKIRVCAEFAKEAMADQALSKGEVLNIRWAHEDPNPSAQRYEQNELNRKAAEGILEKSKEIGIPDEMLEQHDVPDAVPHPYAKYHSGKKSDNKSKSSNSSTLSTQKQYFLQWAQFFASQGIDPSQLDEQTIQYYQQYYSSYYWGQAPYCATGTTPAIESSTKEGESENNETSETSEVKSDETKE